MTARMNHHVVDPKRHLPVLDLETKSIDDHPRPGSPPPVGLAIWFPGDMPMYFSWGHPQGTNGVWTQGRKGELDDVTDAFPDIERAAKMMIKEAYKGEVLGHNIAKFDLPVIEDHLGIKPPPYSRVEDTLFLMFLRDPHSTSLSLKPAAELWLREKPEERDAVYDWLANKGIIQKPKMENGRQKYAKNAGAFISKAPGSLVAAYAIGDVTRAWGLYEQHLPWVEENGMREAYDRERQLAPILLENERQGIRVDMDDLERDIPVARKGLRKSEEWIRKALSIKDKDFWSAKDDDHVFNFNSDAHMAQALKRAKVVTEFPQTPGGKDSVSKKNLRIDHFSDPKVYYAIHYQSTMSAILGRMEKFLEEGAKKGGYIFREWNQVRQGHGEDNMTGARSGRITVGELANMAKRFGNKDPDYKHPAFLRVPEPPMARDYILPDPGDEFGHCDFDQQEMKITAHFEDGALAKQYRINPKTDIHEFVHELILHVTGKDYNRDVVKTLDFRKLFGSGVSGFAEQIREPESVAREIIKAWERALPDVVSLDNSLRDMFREGKPIRTLGGRVYYCKPPTVAKKGKRKGMLVNYFYTALNYLIQPSAADQTKQALIDYHNHPKRNARLLCTVYDEINISMRNRKELAILSECMCNAFKLDVPVTTTAKAGSSWGKLKKLEDLKKGRVA